MNVILRKIEQILRTLVIPIGATILVVLFWRQYECQGYWWFPYAIGVIFVSQYFFFFRKKKTLEVPISKK